MNDFGFQSEPEGSFHEDNRIYKSKRSDAFGTAAIVLSLIAVTTPYFVITTMICAPLAIILGLLSKGGETTLDTRGKTAVILGVIGLVLLVLLLIVSFRIVIIGQYGGWENFMDYYNSLDPSSPYMDTI